jgi:hypothetical protein
MECYKYIITRKCVSKSSKDPQQGGIYKKSCAGQTKVYYKAKDELF